MMTLYQSQEKVLRAIEVGIEAKNIFEKIAGTSSAITVANESMTSINLFTLNINNWLTCVKILVRLSELYSKTAGPHSSSTLQSLKKALEIKETALGSAHPEVKEIKVLVSV
jgi:hypothetical protein